jgi:hypothetical protein
MGCSKGPTFIVWASMIILVISSKRPVGSLWETNQGRTKVSEETIQKGSTSSTRLLEVSFGVSIVQFQMNETRKVGI